MHQLGVIVFSYMDIYRCGVILLSGASGPIVMSDNMVILVALKNVKSAFHG